MKAGGEVTGVEPNFFIENEFQHDGLTKLIVTKDMTERKNKMMELSDVFVALPGGFGAWDEIFHVIACGQVGYHDKKLILFNINNYYDHLVAQAEEAYNQRFTPNAYRCRFTPVNTMHDCIKQLELADISKNSVPLDDE
mgnify:CR=1 FL=1